MAELIWQAEDRKAAGHVATYNSGGATVEIILEAPENAGNAGGAPAWVRVGQELAMRRIREYLDETGRLPSRELLEDFQEEMEKRLDAYIQEPMKHPFRPMGLKAFEDERKTTCS